jgi:tetratricopeptide (TPR) repeat protein
MNLHNAGQWAAALAGYRRLLAADPADGAALAFAGALLCRRGDFTAAEPLLIRALRCEPQRVEARLNLAKLRALAGDWPAAGAGSGRILVLEPAQAEAWETLAASRSQTAPADIDAALAPLIRADRLCPGEPRLRRKLGLLLAARGRGRLARGQTGDAIADLRTALRYLPLDVENGLALGAALVETGQPAAGLFRRLLALAPDNHRLLHNLGVASIRGGDRPAAVAPLRRATVVAPQIPDPCEALAEVWADRDPAAAQAWSSRALTIKLQRARDSGQELTLFATPEDSPASQDARDIVSFSLWGEQEIYCRGAVENARLFPALLPGWRCRFYHDGSAPAAVLAELAALGAELVPATDAGRLGMFWRFRVADDPGVRRFLCRDCDSRPNRREQAAVAAWLASGLPFHVIRDHVMHMEPVMGGMWGGTAGLLPPMEPAIRHFAATRPRQANDQHFLAEWLWPRIARRALVHDEIHPGLGVPLPPVDPPADGWHIGAKLRPLTGPLSRS